MHTEVDPRAIRSALKLLLDIKALAGSEQLRNLLEYLVRNTLEGRTSQLNEIAVAENVLGRNQDFVSLTDSSARKAMSRLRAKLNDYYTHEGAAAEVRFVIRKYRVRFEDYTPCRPRITLLPLTLVSFPECNVRSANTHYLKDTTPESPRASAKSGCAGPAATAASAGSARSAPAC